MQHILFADKSLLVGDDAAEALLEYAALLARGNTADTVKLAAVGPDGSDVTVTFLLDSGTNLVAESTHSTLPEPDNAEAVAYMRKRIVQLSSPPQILADDMSQPATYEGLHLE